MSAAKKPARRALGRGLDALLGAAPPPPAADEAGERYGDGALFECPIERIVPREDQPRSRIAEPGLLELAASIREHGIIQPLVVRRVAPGEDRFELIAGERRWLAAQRAGYKQVPVVVKDVSSAKAFALALVENLQREDLNAIEVAEAYQRLLEDHGYTQQSIAERLGKSRSAVANALRLLRLPAAIRRAVHEGKLSEGHARALLGAPDEASLVRIAERAIRGRWSVRKVEQMVRAARRRGPPEGSGPSGSGGAGGKSPAVRDLELRLARRLGARAELVHRDPGGTLTVRYASLDELDRILSIIGA